MTRPSKWKTKIKKQEQDNKGKFSKKLKLVDVSLLDENEPFKLA